MIILNRQNKQKNFNNSSYVNFLLLYYLVIFRDLVSKKLILEINYISRFSFKLCFCVEKN